jgi:uncharacterized protein
MTSTVLNRDTNPAGWLNDALMKVFTIMGGGLALTAITAMFAASSTAFMAVFTGTALKWVILFAPLVMVLIMSFGYQKLSRQSLMALFLAFAVLNGLSLSVIVLMYSASALVLSFLSASALFLGMAAYGYLTKKDLSSWGSILFVGLIVLLGVMILNMFLGSTILEIVISCAGILLFMALTAYDVQNIKDTLWMEEDNRKAIIMGALSLYLDFLNLFLFILRLFGLAPKTD